MVLTCTNTVKKPDTGSLNYAHCLGEKVAFSLLTQFHTFYPNIKLGKNYVLKCSRSKISFAFLFSRPKYMEPC